MAEKNSNAKKGAGAVDDLIRLLESGDNAVLEACDSVIKTIDQKLASVLPVRVNQITKVKGSYKSDIQVSFMETEVTLAIAVISAGSSRGNQVERKPVDSYRKDQDLPEEMLRLLKLFTGTIRPSEGLKEDFSPAADLKKNYAYLSDLSRNNQDKLLYYLRNHRKAMLSRALLGRGEAILNKGEKVGVDQVALFAFCNKQKQNGKAWSYVAATEVLESIMTTDVQPTTRGKKQIKLGHGITLKRYGGGLYAGDLRLKDYLQIQINPHKVLSESTDWTKFKALSKKISFEIEDKYSSIQSEAAHRGLDAEQVLIDKINGHHEDCTWIVEECCGCQGYGNFKARKPGNKEKPDVLLYDGTENSQHVQGISLKTYKPEVSFSQANRGTLETYVEEFGINRQVAETLRAFTVKDTSGNRTMLNKVTKSEQEELLHFFQSYQRQITSHVLRGKAEAILKADWLLLHEAIDANWISQIGQRDFWHLYPMAQVIDCCCSIKPCITRDGNLTLGLGLTLQRKGGDSGRPSANDLQFKINPRAIIKALANAKIM